MGVYIKGMEMPKEGNWRSIRIYPDGTIGRPIGFGDYALVEGAEAVPVPPHWDLMDKDAAMMRFLDLLKTPGEIYTSDVGEIIANAPTIIPASEEGET